MEPVVRTHRKHHRVPGFQANYVIEWHSLPLAGDAGTENNAAICHYAHVGANIDLRAYKTGSQRIRASSGGREYQVGILPANPGHEQELVRRGANVAVVKGGPLLSSTAGE